MYEWNRDCTMRSDAMTSKTTGGRGNIYQGDDWLNGPRALLFAMRRRRLRDFHSVTAIFFPVSHVPPSEFITVDDDVFFPTGLKSYETRTGPGESKEWEHFRRTDVKKKKSTYFCRRSYSFRSKHNEIVNSGLHETYSCTPVSESFVHVEIIMMTRIRTSQSQYAFFAQ
jgi:hypothetical protein